MLLLQGLLAWLIHSLGRVVNSAFSWATLLLFGKVPRQRQILLSIISLLSVLWIAAAVGIVFPQAGTFLLAMVPLPSWVHANWIRAVMAALSVIMPFTNGLLSSFLAERPACKSGTAACLSAALDGWRLTLALSLTLLLMILIAPITKASELIKGWRARHVLVIIEPQDYPAVVSELKRLLQAMNIANEEKRLNPIIQAPILLLAWLSGKTLSNLVAANLTKLTYAQGELEIRPSDLIVRGPARRINEVVALLIANYGFGSAYLTWSKEGNQCEDGMRDLWKLAQEDRLPHSVALGRADALFTEMQLADLDIDEWQTLYTLWLRLKLDVIEGISELERQVG